MRSREAKVKLLTALHRVSAKKSKKGELVTAINEHLKKKKIRIHLTDKHLRQAYQDVTFQLNVIYGNKNKEGSRTEAEHLFCQIFIEHSRRKYFTSFWIGNHCVDVFVPSYREIDGCGNMFKGLAFEIQGGIHKADFKMKQDAHKEEFLAGLGIRLYQIENDDIHKESTKKILLGVQRSGLLDSTDKRSLLNKIYIETLAARGWDHSEILSRHTGIKGEDLDALLERSSSMIEVRNK